MQKTAGRKAKYDPRWGKYGQDRGPFTPAPEVWLPKPRRNFREMCEASVLGEYLGAILECATHAADRNRQVGERGWAESAYGYHEKIQGWVDLLRFCEELPLLPVVSSQISRRLIDLAAYAEALQGFPNVRLWERGILEDCQRVFWAATDAVDAMAARQAGEVML